MPAAEDRHQQRRDEERALAGQLAHIHERELAGGGPFEIASFHHRAEFAGATFADADCTGAELRIRLAEASGLGPVGGVLAAQCCLELLRRSEAVELAELNRHFLKHPPGENALLAAGALRVQSDSLAWSGSFAGMPAPILVDDSGSVEILMGTGPFLGLAETTFPVIRGLLHPGKRLFLIAGSGAANLCPALCDRLSGSMRLPLDELVDASGRELATALEPGFGLLLLGVERRAHLPLPSSGTAVE